MKTKELIEKISDNKFYQAYGMLYDFALNGELFHDEELEESLRVIEELVNERIRAHRDAQERLRLINESDEISSGAKVIHTTAITISRQFDEYIFDLVCDRFWGKSFQEVNEIIKGVE